ncbi:MAG TPA: carboxymuconolactone decarboxylase family protein [Chloroflexota bacterium]|jgi:alkylhydroperoxidase family enzyme|nr:carboxymuconolactone decarboxylase family protein [Chloroflexota bacterium]
MARVEYPAVETAEAQRMADEVRQQRGGRFPHLFHMQMYNPAIVDGWLRLGSAVRFKSELDDATRELAICLVARLTGAEYEWQAHRKIAGELGLPPALLDDVRSWRDAADVSDKHRAVLALAEGLTQNVDVDDTTFTLAQAHLSPREMVELVTTVAYYNMVARFLVGLRVDLEA